MYGNFLVKVDILSMCAYSLENLILFFSERTLKFDQNVLFCATCVKPVLHVDMNLDDREAVWIIMFLTVNIQVLLKCHNY